MKRIIKNIFLDTNIYEENNFFHSSIIQSIFYYSKTGVIDLYMTTISKFELIDRMKKRLIEVKEDHNRLVNSINKPKSRILKNLTEYEQIEKSLIIVEKATAELSKKLNTIIETSNIKIISAENVLIEDVFNSFYKQEPPFCSNGKKFEFPDAFIVKSIDSWCIKNRKKIIFLTKDNDFTNYKSSHLIFKTDLSDVLVEITNYYDSLQKNQIIPSIHKTLENNREALLDLIDTNIDSVIRIDLDYEQTTKPLRTKAKLHNYKITTIRPKYAEVTYYVEFESSFTIFPTPIDIGRLIFEDGHKPKRILKNLIIPCDIEINLKNLNDIRLKWINSNQKILINLE